MRWYLLSFMVIVASCSSHGDTGKNPEQEQSEIDQATAQLDALNAEIAEAERKRNELADENKAEAARMASAPALDPEPLDLCFKDYCPCEPPQGGPDMLLCDMLETGQPVDEQMLISGRAMREVRRQLDTGDY
ncbi:hypothetical protein [Blastomonas sp.]|uniref:hypothetical protein n=1 Tax=Blastomonas sp. TaxID=1909299 RepID=UPI0035935D89